VHLAPSIRAGQSSEERQEIIPGVPRPALADHLATGDVQRGIQACQPVAAIVVRLACGQPRPQAQQGLGPAQGQNLRLLVHTQDDLSGKKLFAIALIAGGTFLLQQRDAAR